MGHANLLRPHVCLAPTTSPDASSPVENGVAGSLFLFLFESMLEEHHEIYGGVDSDRSDQPPLPPRRHVATLSHVSRGAWSEEVLCDHGA